MNRYPQPSRDARCEHPRGPDPGNARGPDPGNDRGNARGNARHSSRSNQRGLTLVELIVAFTIMALLTTMAVPLARYKVRRDKERQLTYALREMRKAIDDYKDAALAGKIEVKLGTEGYPETLDQLVNGVKLLQDAQGKKIKFLRRVPLDPMTNSRDWGYRSMQDDPASQSWGRQNIFDIYTKSTDRARDGTAYAEW